MATYQQTFNKDSKEFFMQQAKGFVKDLVKYTQPKTQSEQDPSPMKMGQFAVKRDVTRAVAPLDMAEIRDPKIKKRLQKAGRDGDKEAVRAVLQNIPSMKKYSLVDFSPDQHKKTRTGSESTAIGVKSSKYKLTLDKEPFKTYLKEVQGRVGRFKASWYPAFEKLGITLPRWISQHAAWSKMRSKAELKLTDQEQSLTIWNGSHLTGKLRDSAAFVSKLRYNNMVKDMQIKLEYLVKKMNGGH